MNRDNDKGKVLIGRSLVLAAGQIVLLIIIIARLYYLQVYTARCWQPTVRISKQ
ncbi:MAG: hypothetical protein KHX55_03055 [Proteobacteria bacterium]|nr:hypothetical protein [Pseudomonadota bacterium]